MRLQGDQWGVAGSLVGQNCLADAVGFVGDAAVGLDAAVGCPSSIRYIVAAIKQIRSCTAFHLRHNFYPTENIITQCLLAASPICK